MVTVNASSTTRISVSTNGAPGEEQSYFNKISADGRFVTFVSVSHNLTSDLYPGGSYVQSFLRDIQTGTTKLITMSYSGVASSEGGFSGGVSDDGRFVVFTSDSNDIVPDQNPNELTKVFLRDMVSGTTIQMPTPAPFGTETSAPVISGDGRYVIYFEAGSISRYDVFAGTTAIASMANGGSQVNPNAIGPNSDLSRNGRFVTFESGDSTVVDTDGGDSNGVPDIFVRDMKLETTIRASLSNTGGEANGSSSDAAISANGRYIVFTSDATNLIAGGDNNGKKDIYIRDTVANTTKLVSATYDDLLSDGDSTTADVSADGRYVVFQSVGANIHRNDFNGVSDIFLRDTVAGTTVRVSVGRQGADANGASTDAHISADGRFVTYSSLASNLVAGDVNGKQDVFRVSLSASEQADYLIGSAKADTIQGFGGSDIIVGGTGADTMDGGGDDDTFYVDNGGDKVIEAAGGGFGTILTSVSFVLTATSEVELIRADQGSFGFFPVIDLTGSNFANTLVGNNAANTLDGKAGADVMQGFAGDDRYFVDTSGDVIKEAAGIGGGMDKVYTSVGYTLKAGVEVEVLGTTNGNSTANLNLNGNEFANTINGNAGVNFLSGMGENDSLNGLNGNDKLTGGTGDDFFVFTTTPNGTTNFDRIADFSNVSGNDDQFRLENGVFTKLGAAGALSTAAFRFNAAGTAADLDDRIVYNTTTGELFYDADGNKAGGVAAVKFASIDNFASLTGAAALSAADFFII